jgi:protein SCO1/2
MRHIIAQHKYTFLSLVLICMMYLIYGQYYTPESIAQKAGTIIAGDEQGAITGHMGQGSPIIGGAFELVDNHGNVFTEENLKGKHSLVYFGFTYCPDVCPIGLQAMADAHDQLPKEVQDKVNLVFVTVDPERDDPELLSHYLPNFSENMIGLTGTQKQVKDAAKAYKVYYAKDEREDLDALGNYLLNHSSYIYLMDTDGVTNIGFFKHEASPEVIRDGVLQYAYK